MSLMVPGASRGITSFHFDGPTADALVMEGVPALIVAGGHFTGREGFRWFVDAGEKRLYEVAALTAHLLRVGMRWDSGGMVGSIAQLSSPVGGERLIRIEPFFSPRATFALSGVGSVHTVAFDGYADVHLVSVGVRMFVRLGDGLALAYGIENYRVWGEELAGAEVAVRGVVRLQDRVTAVLGARSSRGGELGVGTAVCVTLREAMGIVLGYDDGTESFRAAVRIDFGHVGVAVGAGVHSVLGLSRAASLRLRG